MMKKIDEGKFSGSLEKIHLKYISGGDDKQTGTQTEFTRCSVDVSTGTMDTERFGDNTGDPCQ